MPYAYSSMNLNSGNAPAAECGLSSVSSNSVEWVEIVEPQAKQLMYVNLISGQYSWETPPDASVKRTHENQWWELFDSKMGRYYYYNAASMKTTWQRPMGDEIDIIPLAKLQTLEENTESAEHARMEEGEDTPPMRFVACGRDDKKPYMRILQAGRKRSTGDRSPERNSDEDLDIMEDTPSSQPSTPRGVPSRGFFPEPPQERQSGGQKFRKLVPHWTDASRMTLIEEVSKKRNLWDITSAAYKDKQRSDVDWHKVKEDLNAAFNSCYEVDDVKKQWKNLRDSFQKRMKAAKEPKTGSGAGDPPTKWIFWEAMQFLLDFNDEEPTMSNVGQYGLSSGGTSTAHYATSESRSGSNSPAPSRFGFRADVPRKAALEKKKGDGSKTAALSRICSELGTMNHELGTMNHELETMNQSPQTGDQFDAFGAFASTTLRKLAATDEEAAELVVLELSENLSKLVREALVRKRSV